MLLFHPGVPNKTQSGDGRPKKAMATQTRTEGLIRGGYPGTQPYLVQSAGGNFDGWLVVERIEGWY